jgi:phage anti-repressor protein
MIQSKNVDYIINKSKISEGSGGHNFEIITLTPEAAKKICLSTNSKMGPLVQQYFLDLEVALYKYKNYIIDGLSKKIKQESLTLGFVVDKIESRLGLGSKCFI